MHAFLPEVEHSFWRAEEFRALIVGLVITCNFNWKRTGSTCISYAPVCGIPSHASNICFCTSNSELIVWVGGYETLLTLECTMHVVAETCRALVYLNTVA